MRISFHYSLPEGHALNPLPPDGFSTPPKNKTLYGSRETQESVLNPHNCHTHRLHQLLPSRSPLRTAESPNKTDQPLSSPGCNQKLSLSCQVELSRNNIQCEIEELKIVLRELADQAGELEQERDDNRSHYKRLLGVLDQQGSLIMQKAQGLEAAVVELRIDMEDELASK